MTGIIGPPNNIGTGLIGTPSGMVIQTVITEVTGAQSTGLTDFTHFGDYDTNITPYFTNSIIRITFTSSVYNSTNDGHTYVTAYRNTTNLGHSSQGIKLVSSGPSGGGKWNNMHFIIRDTGHNTTSQITYKLYCKAGSGTAQLNYAS